MSTLFDAVRSAAKDVATHARFVRVRADRIEAYAHSIYDDLARPAELDPAHHYFGDESGTVTYLFLLDAINFGSGYFPHLQKIERLSGYFTVATRLKEDFEKRGPWTAARMEAVTPAECARIFGQEGADAHAQELMGLFARAIADLGRFARADYDRDLRGAVARAGRSAERLVGDLSRMPYWNDTAIYRGRVVPFFKRAQLLAADLAIAFKGEGPGRFDDLDRLTIFADNLVPHVLRLDGILEVDDGLAQRIADGVLIPAGSEEEIELRATAIFAVEEMVAALARAGKKTTAVRIDYLLWNRGQSPVIKAHPRHRTRTTFY